jgi:DNA-binding GntR family transcriptional regulator
MVLDEHAAIIAAVAARDPARASAAMTAHLEGLQASIVNVRDLNPDYFIDEAPARAALAARRSV